MIEVIASLAILGTLLVAVVVAKARFAHQWQGSNQRSMAVRAADRLLEQWWQSRTPTTQPAAEFSTSGGSQEVPVSGAGVWVDGMRWRTQALPSPHLADLHAQRVRLEILSERGDTAGEVLASVDVVVPLSEESPSGKGPHE